MRHYANGIATLAMAAFTLSPACSAIADEPRTQPAAAEPAKRPPISVEVEKILDRLEKKTVDTAQTPMTYAKIDPVLNDKQEYEGTLLFKREEPNPRFLVAFDRVIRDGVKINKKEWHQFDGEWYSEARESTETIVKRQIVRPGERLEVFQLGKGPFPLPFGQKKDEILRQFDVTLVPPAKDDPKNADHLTCQPVAGTELAGKYKVIHFFIDRELDLPVRIRTVDTEGNEILVGFPADKIVLNKAITGSRLNLPDETRKYSIQTEPLPPASADASASK